MMKVVVSSQIRHAVLGVINEHSRARSRHEISITMYVARIVHPGKHFVEETLNLLVRALGPEFSDPNWTALSDLARVIDVLLKVRNVIRTIEPNV